MTLVQRESTSIGGFGLVQPRRFLEEIAQIAPRVDILRGQCERALHEPQALVGTSLLVAQNAEEVQRVHVLRHGAEYLVIDNFRLAQFARAVSTDRRAQCFLGRHSSGKALFPACRGALGRTIHGVNWLLRLCSLQSRLSVIGIGITITGRLRLHRWRLGC